MKKLKVFSGIMMMVLCIGVLAMGIYAANPGTNSISGNITVNAAAAPVTITAYSGTSTSGTRLGSMTTRAGDTLPIGEIVIDQIDDVLENNSKDIFLTFSTTSDKLLVLDAPSMLIFDATASSTNENVDAVLKSVQTVTYTTTATENSNGLKYFTSGSDCSMLCHLSLTQFFEQELTLTFNLDINVLEASDATAYSADGTTYTFGSFPQSAADVSSLTLTDTGLNFMAYNDVKWEDLYTYFSIFKDEDNEKYIQVGESYYKYEPLTWTKLTTTDGVGEMLICNTSVENVRYRKNYSYTTFGESTTTYYYATDVNGNVLTDSKGNPIYANNYKESDLRAYMNDAFYNGAFTVLESQLIATTTVNNSAATTKTSPNIYACEDTTDNIFALSYQETFGSSAVISDLIIHASGYSIGQGVYERGGDHGCDWWLRSPYVSTDYYACGVSIGGGGDNSRAYGNDVGCVPALFLSKEKSR